MKKQVLFLCRANSCRSQMAEGMVNHYLKESLEAFSAGTVPASVHPLATAVMQEIGIDISGHRSKGVEEFADRRFDYVVTLCDEAREDCPLFLRGGRMVHMGFDDPAAARGSEEEIMAVFRRVRDEIRERIVRFFSEG